MNMDIPEYCVMRVKVLFKPTAVGFDSILEGNRGHSFIPARWDGSNYFS
jgi:hypothetical protein